MRRPTLPAALAVVTAVAALAAGPVCLAEAPATDPLLQGYVETVNVQLVLLHATVLNKKGEVITDLSPKDFDLREDGVEQEISVFGTSHDQSVKVAFLLDVSGSMGLHDRLGDAKAAIKSFVGALQPGDQIALMSFADSGVNVEVGFTTNRFDFFQKLSTLQPYGQTALRDALARASSLMAEAAGSRAALVLVSDGAENASRMTKSEAISLARQVQVPIYAIGFTRLPGHLRRGLGLSPEERAFAAIIQEFTGETGGEHLQVFGPDETARAVALVEERLRGQYLIGYRPKDGAGAPGFRSIDLRTARASLKVLTRKGYVSEP